MKRHKQKCLSFGHVLPAQLTTFAAACDGNFRSRNQTWVVLITIQVVPGLPQLVTQARKLNTAAEAAAR